MEERKGSARFAVAWALGGLVLGFILGSVGHATASPVFVAIGQVAEPAGTLWTNALKVIVVPLVASLLFSSIAGMPSGRAFGRWGWTSVATFGSILALGAAFSVVGTTIGLSLFSPRGSLPPTAAKTEVQTTTLTVSDWFGGLLPSNLFDSFSTGDLLPIMLFTVLLALSARSLPEQPRATLLSFANAVRDALLAYVRWVMLVLPIGAFALAFTFSLQTGVAAAGVVLHFLVLASCLLVGFTVILYLLAAVVGKVGVLRFGSAALAPQTVALGSRSSVASLPALVQAADEKLQLPAPASSIALPLGASVFKPNRTVSSTAKLLFMAAALGIALAPGDIAAFVLTVVLLSISTPGIPSMGSNITLGAYMAAGIPAEVALLFDPVDTLLDMLKTLVNVTGNLASAVIVSRICAPAAVPLGAAGEPLPAEA